MRHFQILWILQIQRDAFFRSVDLLEVGGKLLVTGAHRPHRVACKLLDLGTAQCRDYKHRRAFVPDCVRLTPKTLPKIAYWMPKTCAYRLLWAGEALPDWHPLVTGDPESPHAAGQSVRGWTVPEFEVDEDDWDDYIIEETP